MSRSVDTLLGRPFGGSTRSARRRRLGFEREFFARPEELEARALLATVDVQVGTGPMGMSFSPSTVTINVGDTVHWMWVGSLPHTVTSVAGSIETYESGILNPGSTFDHTFTDAGTFV